MVLEQLKVLHDSLNRFNSYYVNSSLYVDSIDPSIDYFVLNAPNQKSVIVYADGTEAFYVPSEEEYLILADLFVTNKKAQDPDYNIWKRYLDGERNFG